MSQDPRSSAREQLAGTLTQIMADGRVDEMERLQLKAIFEEGVLTVSDVKAVFSQYLKGLQAEVLEDGLITEEEKEKCRAVVRELAIPRALLSPEILAIVDDRPLPK